MPVIAVSGFAALFSGACTNTVGGSTSGTPSGTPTGSGGSGGGGGGLGGEGGVGGPMAPPGCSSDADCAKDPAGDVCDVATGECVGCLPSKDTCQQGKFCDPKTNTCEIGCTDNADCPSFKPLCDLPTNTCVGCLPQQDICDPGQYCNPATNDCAVGCTDDTDCDPANGLLCNTGTHNCVGCLVDNNCPLGSVCIANTCVPGCSGMHACQPGFTCCSSTCYDIDNDVEHCGDCSTACDKPNHGQTICSAGTCGMGLCEGVWGDCDADATNGCEHNTLQDGACACAPGQTQACYTGTPGTENVGLCKGGMQECNPDGLSWGDCMGQVLPVSEICADNIDQDCDGILDNATDLDGDGWTVCNGDCCDSVSAACPTPKLINPGAYEFLNDGVDNDCNPSTTDVLAPSCNSIEKFAGVSGDDFAKAVELCVFTTANAPLPQKTWGVIKTEQLLANGNAPGAALTNMQNWQTAILTNYGTGGVVPKKGGTMVGMSSGKMRDANDPGFVNPNGGSSFASASQPPAAYLAAHGGNLPSSAGCSGNCPAGSGANDSVNTRLTIRVPTNAKSFSYNFRFFSAEYWTFSCTSYNDFYLALLGTGAAGIPADKNISFDGLGNPVSVNNGFFDVCTVKGCYTCPLGNGPLAGTGMEVGNTGGATAWLTTDAPIVPGETMTLDLMIFDVSDGVLDSLVLVDNFTWNAADAVVGTHE